MKQETTAEGRTPELDYYLQQDGGVPIHITGSPQDAAVTIHTKRGPVPLKLLAPPQTTFLIDATTQEYGNKINTRSVVIPYRPSSEYPLPPTLALAHEIGHTWQTLNASWQQTASLAFAVLYPEAFQPADTQPASGEQNTLFLRMIADLGADQRIRTYFATVLHKTELLASASAIYTWGVLDRKGKPIAPGYRPAHLTAVFNDCLLQHRASQIVRPPVLFTPDLVQALYAGSFPLDTVDTIIPTTLHQQLGRFI